MASSGPVTDSNESAAAHREKQIDPTGILDFWASFPHAWLMSSYNPAMQKAHLADVQADAHGLISKKTAELDGVAVTEVTFAPGARWSNDLKPHAGTDLCELPHVALVTTGVLRVVLGDGAQQDFSAGDVMLLPPGHDAWSVGDQACTFVEFSRGNDYYT